MALSANPIGDVSVAVTKNDPAERPALADERAHVEVLYRRLDRMREETLRLRTENMRAGDGTPGGRVQQDIALQHHNATIASLNLAEDRLVFGRIDSVDPATGEVELMHIGRLGMFGEGADDRQLLMDWRAPSARPFYVATAGHPLGLSRRRHLRVRRRRLESMNDEYLDTSPATLAALGVSADEVVASSGPGGESALLDALNAPRTGRMSDIVETIQAEQDDIIRSDRAGVLVVQGGPGTGKTAVALHRAAYLLYTHRDQLSSRGVLMIGPNRTFIDYIGSVLPSLGENAVVLRTLGELVPGVSATRHDDPEVARLKGRRSAAGIIANAVLDRQRLPKRAFTLLTGQGAVDVTADMLRRAQARGWASRLPHNRARTVVIRSLVRDLARQVARRQSKGVNQDAEISAEDYKEIRRDLATDETVAAALAPLWPEVSPARLLSELFTVPGRLAFAAPELSPQQRELLMRSPGSTWTVSDVPLLDEAAELLGEAPKANQDTAQREARQEYAQGVLDMLEEARSVGEEEGLGAILGMVGAADLADVRDQDQLVGSTADRAGDDREWTYGHVMVDEAQELSPMAWRAVLRRCPARSMTLVGDVAQTSDPAGATSWAKALKPHVGDGWRLAELTVNYRTPAEISAVADRVLRRINPRWTAPTAIRSAGVDPWWRQSEPDRLTADVLAAARDELEQAPGRSLAVLVPRALQHRLQNELAAEGHGERAVVLSVPEAKGLEFDIVLLVEPDLIERESSRGLGDVYVAVTRATQRLGVLYTGRPPRISR